MDHPIVSTGAMRRGRLLRLRARNSAGETIDALSDYPLPDEGGQSFQQFNRTDIDFGSDIDGDGTNEHVDVEGLSTVMSRESITVPAGTYRTRSGWKHA